MVNTSYDRLFICRGRRIGHLGVSCVIGRVAFHAMYKKDFIDNGRDGGVVGREK